ncbi:ComEC/Rec2 family competence protein [Clostridium beijerinckii]|uniref:ComEC/Rec2 family competence protein n=1 Tax=Clostridium beijerinckii TaxID=1520 RepID=UPI00098CAD96|nr:ComEC/Rec2 family competence protein [Clostridium beijerinckii]MBA8937293.1 beta-lactamase superfamily II metal-dependent hydrolase [Clostridium beijerinckii]NRU40241.1 beta-lactamase superfamily II metal-dependent hydrolase [Clostridium beijerinckii]NSA96482.1 beta-lactamase superfamily II metal-dependent hydrolase [Clostridium beijerinckii]OOM61798.1 hydroxyacylglutathione hydrolase [Clostridium beijerinckii]OOM68535.1 hydroxyacylglutathione hydrolase [Clostridium beijerinckii]
MTKTKKVISLLLTLLFSLFLISCGKSSQVNNVNNTNSTTAATTETKIETQKTLEDLKIHYIDVGQGDSELIQIGDKNILIDAGTSDKKALDYLKSIGITTIDYAIATHPHEDHIGSMDDVINNLKVGTFYAPKATTTTKTFENMVDALKNKNLKMNVPKVGDQITVGDATLTFLAPNSAKYEDLNNYSIVCKLKYGNNSFIFMGDAEDVSEGEILQKQLDIQADVLKVGHHGSHSYTTQAFLDKVNPKYAVISCEKGNDYGHPHEETLDKLNAKNINVFRTDLEGTVIATSDGTNITFNVKPVDKANDIAPKKTNKKDN